MALDYAKLMANEPSAFHWTCVPIAVALECKTVSEEDSMMSSVVD